MHTCLQEGAIAAAEMMTAKACEKREFLLVLLPVPSMFQFRHWIHVHPRRYLTPLAHTPVRYYLICLSHFTSHPLPHREVM